MKVHKKIEVVYPGSFDPPTLGHWELIQRSAAIFDFVHVGIGVNSKKTSLLSSEQRLKCLQTEFKGSANVAVHTFEGLTVDFVKRLGAQAIVRGVRNEADWSFEMPIAQTNKTLAPEIETIVLAASQQYGFISSSIVREIFLLGGDVRHLVPVSVYEVLKLLRV